MILFPSMLIRPAEKAGMKVPDLGNGEDFNTEEYPHFNVFCTAQLGRRMSSWTEHWDNAKVISSIPEDKIRSITLRELIDLGFAY
jgi:hypothetical protein